MLINLIFIILQTISMTQFTMDRHIDNPIIPSAYSSALHKQQAYVELPADISTLQSFSEKVNTKELPPYNPFIVDKTYKIVYTKKRLEIERENLSNSIMVLELVTEEIRKMNVLDLHIFTKRTGIYDKYTSENLSMGIMLRELHVLDEEYRNTHDELRQKNIISRLEQIRVVLYHHVTGHLNYKRILYAIISSRIYIYDVRIKIIVSRTSFTRLDPFTNPVGYEIYWAKDRLETQRDNLTHSIMILEITTEEIRRMDELDLHRYAGSSGMYSNHMNKDDSMGRILRQLEALGEEYKNTRDELRKKSIISSLKQLQIEFYHHLTGRLNYKRIIHAITLFRIYIYEFRAAVERATRKR